MVEDCRSSHFCLPSTPLGPWGLQYFKGPWWCRGGGKGLRFEEVWDRSLGLHSGLEFGFLVEGAVEKAFCPSYLAAPWTLRHPLRALKHLWSAVCFIHSGFSLLYSLSTRSSF